MSAWGILLFELLPFEALLLALAVGLFVAWRSSSVPVPTPRAINLNTAELGQIALGLGVSVFLVLLLVSHLGVCIRPVERFENPAGVDSWSALLSDIVATEATVCGFITQANQFIQSDVGMPGQNNPALVTAAIASAQQGLVLTDCSASVVDVVTATTAATEADNRIARLETTVNSYTGPVFLKTYNRTVPCPPIEGFDGEGEGSLSALRQRLTVVQQTVHEQQVKYLTPINDMTAQLQRGQASDCQKQQGSKVGMAAATGKP